MAHKTLTSKSKCFVIIVSMALARIKTNVHAAIDKNLSPGEITAIAKEVYICAYPMMDDYRVIQDLSDASNSVLYLLRITDTGSQHD